MFSELEDSFLGGGNSNICNFHPYPWGNDPNFIFNWVQTTNHPWTPKTHGKMKVLSPRNMGEITPKNEGNVGSNGSLAWLFKPPTAGVSDHIQIFEKILQQLDVSFQTCDTSYKVPGSSYKQSYGTPKWPKING